MLTFVEAISLAGDRKKQNDDACGWLGDRGWVIDGATDLHGTPLTGWASDASWMAHYANHQLSGFEGMNLQLAIFEISTAASFAFANVVQGQVNERWQSPTASVLIVEETKTGLSGLDLGDCRCFALDADAAAHVAGSKTNSSDDESERARDASQRSGATALLRDPDTLTTLRAVRARHNTPDGYWVFGLQPECADHARAWSLTLSRPAHLLLCTDGFSALVDRYQAYDAAGLVRAALDKGLQELGRELRAIETADAGGAKHPRFKPSDDATAVLLRLT
jgi:serine/threonine protein phosphatase PrpC